MKINLLVLLLIVAISYAAIPRVISYQGRITNDGTGDPLPDGLYSVTFRLFADETGGVALWTDNYPTLSIVNGLYAVMLGSNTPFPTAVDFANQYWLEVQVSATTLEPRYRMGASPYALSIADTINRDQSEPALALINAGDGNGLYGEGGHRGIKGYTWSSGFDVAGVEGRYSSVTYGLLGYRADDGSYIGVYGDGSNYAGYFNDNVHIEGSLSAGKQSVFYACGADIVPTTGVSVTYANYGGAGAIYRGSAGDETIILPISIPSLLYGQPVRLDSVVIGYMTPLLNGYISQTTLCHNPLTATYSALITDYTDYSSSVFDSYTLEPSSELYLDSSTGPLFIQFIITFVDVGHIEINGAKIFISHK